MQELVYVATVQDIVHLDTFIASKLQLLSSVRSREDRELIEVQITDLEKRRQELATLLPAISPVPEKLSA